MQGSTTDLHISAMVGTSVYRETRFRTPTGAEKQSGLWVDRLGAGPTAPATSPQPRLRILGQYAAVAIESGTGRLQSARTGIHSVSARDVIFVPPDDPCTYGPLETEWQSRWIVWNGPEAYGLRQLGYIGSTATVVRAASLPVLEAWNELSSAMHKEDLGAVLERKIIVLRMVLDLYRMTERTRSSCGPAQGIARAVDYLTRNAACSVSIPELARLAGVSETHFRRLFREHTGRSPTQFLAAARISRAKELLTRGVPVKIAAAEVGYRDVFYFSRVFKQLTGTSPGRFASLHH